MQSLDVTESFEPNPVAAMWQYRWVVIGTAVLFAVLGVLFARLRPAQFEATAGLAVSDPLRSDIFGSAPATSPERYVADQVEILRSGIVARRASEVALTEEPPVDLTPGEILRRTSIGSDPDTDFITIRFRASDGSTAQAGADAVALAYQDVIQAEADASRERLLERLDAAIAEVDEELDSLQEETVQILSDNPTRAGFEEQLQELVDRIVELGELARGTGPEADEAGSEIIFVVEELRARQLIQSLEAEIPEVAALIKQQEEARALREALRLRRGEIQTAGALSGSGVTLFSPAGPGKAMGIGSTVALVVSTAFGLLVGGAVAYYLASRRQPLANRMEPKPILDAPPLAEIPDFAYERIETVLPAMHAPASVAAESFRFVATALDMRPGSEGRMRSNGDRPRTVGIVSATVGEGKTTVAANTAIAAARVGRKVLALDADFGSQELSRLLTEEEDPGPGFADFVEFETPLTELLRYIQVEDDVVLNLLSGGTTPALPISLFSSVRMQAMLNEIGREVDLVVIDVPPLLNVAYSGIVARLCDAVVVVVPHRSAVAQLREVRDRLDFLNIKPIGYVYNQAPLRRGKATAGSTRSEQGAPRVSSGFGHLPFRQASPDPWGSGAPPAQRP